MVTLDSNIILYILFHNACLVVKIAGYVHLIVRNRGVHFDTKVLLKV
jgi:hypothetical protein